MEVERDQYSFATAPTAQSGRAHQSRKAGGTGWAPRPERRAARGGGLAAGCLRSDSARDVGALIRQGASEAPASARRAFGAVQTRERENGDQEDGGGPQLRDRVRHPPWQQTLRRARCTAPPLHFACRGVESVCGYVCCVCVRRARAAVGLRDPRGGGRRLFPETRELLDEEEEIADLTITNTEIASSLPLQMLLYFNVQYSLFWGLITLSLMVFKVLCMCATAAAFQPLSLPPSLSRYTRNHTCAAAAAHLRQERRVWPWRARLCVCARGSRRRPQDCCMI